VSNAETLVRTLLNGIEFDDSRLYDLIDALVKDVYDVVNQINPPQTATVFGATGQVISPSPITAFTAIAYPNDLKLLWAAAAILSSYEIRYKPGTGTAADWDTAQTILVTTTLSADINPLTIPLTIGSHTFLIKSLNTLGNYSATAEFLIVTVPQIGFPVVTNSVIGNSVLLYWTVPSSLWAIAYYNVYKNGILQGRVTGTFEAVFEPTGGTFTYVVQAVDIVGNLGQPSLGVTVIVSNPADYILHSVLNSTFSGTKVNCAAKNVGGVDYLLACINAVESFQDHFINNGWANVQDQIDAGFPLYIEPSEVTASYQEVFDFGTIVQSIIVVLDWSEIAIVGDVSTTTCTIEVSDDNITYSAPVTGTSTFAQSVRYVRFTMNFIGADNKSLSFYSNLRCLLNVHYEQDGGQATLNAGDVGGTAVTFNKAFKSVLSIVLTANSTTPIYITYDFAYPINPLTFQAYAFDAVGARATIDVTWLARGIF
jgi:hypothetical protein